MNCPERNSTGCIIPDENLKINNPRFGIGCDSEQIAQEVLARLGNNVRAPPALSESLKFVTAKTLQKMFLILCQPSGVCHSGEFLSNFEPLRNYSGSACLTVAGGGLIGAEALNMKTSEINIEINPELSAGIKKLVSSPVNGYIDNYQRALNMFVAQLSGRNGITILGLVGSFNKNYHLRLGVYDARNISYDQASELSFQKFLVCHILIWIYLCWSVRIVAPSLLLNLPVGIFIKKQA